MSRSSFAGARFAAVALVAALATPAVLPAQARTQVTPFFGAFFAPLPYGRDIDQSGTGTGPFADERLTNAPAVGLRIAFAIRPSIGFEAQGAFVFTGRQTKLDEDPPVGFFIPGNAVMASGRVTYHPRRSNFRGIFGVGYQKLGGDAWDEGAFPGAEFNTSSVGGILGFGVRANVTPRLSLDITLETFLHSSDPAGFDEKQFQADMMLTVGVPVTLGN